MFAQSDSEFNCRLCIATVADWRCSWQAWVYIFILCQTWNLWLLPSHISAKQEIRHQIRLVWWTLLDMVYWILSVLVMDRLTGTGTSGTIIFATYHWGDNGSKGIMTAASELAQPYKKHNGKREGDRNDDLYSHGHSGVRIYLDCRSFLLLSGPAR